MCALHEFEPAVNMDFLVPDDDESNESTPSDGRLVHSLPLAIRVLYPVHEKFFEARIDRAARNFAFYQSGGQSKESSQFRTELLCSVFKLGTRTDGQGFVCCSQSSEARLH